MAAQYFGTIKSFDLQKGWGHIECETTKAMYGKDIFLLKSQCNGTLPIAGDTVYFDITEGQKGVEAANVQIVASQQEGVYMGTIKSWNPQKKWGHIICDATHQLYGKDIFVMGSAIPGGQCSAGDQVRFQVAEGQKGPEAAKVQVVSSQSATVPQRVPQQPQQIVQFGGMGGQTYTGTVKGFDLQKGWGHIVCDQTRQIYGKDMFVMKSALQGITTLAAGQQVQFNVAVGSKGPECRDVRLAGMGGAQLWQQPAWGQQRVGAVVPSPMHQQGFTPAPKAPVQPFVLSAQMLQSSNGGRQFSGTVKNWNETKGWGFITCAEAQAVYGKDVFLHKKELFGQTPYPGAPLTFTVNLDAKDNRPIAGNVSLNGGGFQAAGMVVPPRVAPY